ncbi:MAG TPA: ABC transporter ATP-binding protein [Sphingomicrobium sp.]|jgi:oligopeptide transport system ATP-binding protein|nr:ABC transporter ATP-binding protein [Sphingomicrobium sp.]
MALLEVHGLSTFFHLRSGVVRAVDDVSFEIERGQTVGIVGESGSGKSVTCYSLLRLIHEPGRIEGGQVLFNGEDLLKVSEARMREIRGGKISMIFQDPMTSLNPFLRISTQMVEALALHSDLNEKAALRKAISALEEVGIADAEKRIHGYPHEFSGGMRQRVMIASALITEPDVLIADEPTTALDVTIQAQILDLIKDRQERLGTAVILVTHDLGVVAGNCDRVNVMYAGRVVESGTTEQIFYDPKHAYTQALQKAIPSLQMKGDLLYTVPGMPPDLGKPITGCAFYPRCPYPKIAEPDGAPPELIVLSEGHCVQDCHYCDRSKPIEAVLTKDVPEARE